MNSIYGFKKRLSPSRWTMKRKPWPRYMCSSTTNTRPAARPRQKANRILRTLPLRERPDISMNSAEHPSPFHTSCLFARHSQKFTLGKDLFFVYLETAWVQNKLFEEMYLLLKNIAQLDKLNKSVCFIIVVAQFKRTKNLLGKYLI